MTMKGCLGAFVAGHQPPEEISYLGSHDLGYRYVVLDVCIIASGTDGKIECNTL